MQCRSLPSYDLEAWKRVGCIQIRKEARVGGWDGSMIRIIIISMRGQRGPMTPTAKSQNRRGGWPGYLKRLFHNPWLPSPSHSHLPFSFFFVLVLALTQQTPSFHPQFFFLFHPCLLYCKHTGKKERIASPQGTHVFAIMRKALVCVSLLSHWVAWWEKSKTIVDNELCLQQLYKWLQRVLSLPMQPWTALWGCCK